jgi:hypothetical protein
MDPTATPENQKSREPANLLHVDQTVQFNLGSISETPFQTTTFSACPKQTDWDPCHHLGLGWHAERAH